MSDYITKSFTAGSGGVTRHAFVKFSSGTVVLTTAVSDVPIGIAVDDADSGELVNVVISGKFKLKAGGAITQGANIMPKASGAGAGLTHSGTTGDIFAARALKTADADGDVIEVLLYDYKPAAT